MTRTEVSRIFDWVISLGLQIPDENDEDIDIISKALKRIWSRLDEGSEESNDTH